MTLKSASNSTHYKFERQRCFRLVQYIIDDDAGSLVKPVLLYRREIAMIRKGASILLLLTYLTTVITVVGEEAECKNSNDETTDNAVACSDSDPDCPNWARDGLCMDHSCSRFM